jgi:glutamate/tyrosine decarboxylase-like PLP-dependent enzyme
VDGDGPSRASLDAAVADLAARFRAALEPPPRAGIAVDTAELRQHLDEPLPERGMPVERILGELEDRLAGSLPGTTGPRYFGYVTGGVLPGAAVIHAWTAAVDQNPGLWALSPGASELEELALRWLASLLDYPLGSGIFTTGATMANLTGLLVARHWLGSRHGVDVASQGVRALPELAVYGSEELHLSDVKALRTLGLGSECIRRIPIDEEHALRVDELARAVAADRAAGLAPAIVIAQAGSVGTGASDPLAAIADVCAEEGMWMHVDAAWGAFLRASRRADLVAGLERADSIALDGHKWLNLPNGIGAALFRDGDPHRAALAGSAAYLTRPAGAGDDSHERSVEASRNWRGAAAWAALKELGREGVAELVDRCLDLAAALSEAVQRAPRLELVAPAPTVVVNFRYLPEGASEGAGLDALNRRIIEDVTAAGEVLVTGASFPSGFCLRATVVSWRTRREDVEAVVEAVASAGDRLASL